MVRFAALALFLIACSGDGKGLDAGGRATGEILNHRPDAAKADSLLSLIQTTIFTPICMQCHVHPYSPYGMSLEPDRSAAIVGRSSQGYPGMVIVEPGDPDNSYLIWKLAGRREISGYRMPYNGAPLTERQVGLIRSWINSLP